MDQKIKNSMLNNIKIFNELCLENKFIPYHCTNDNLEEFIKNVDRKYGNAVTNELKNTFVNENKYNFKM
jgi:hypothetical protein